MHPREQHHDETAFRRVFNPRYDLDLGGNPFTDEDLDELARLDPAELSELAKGAHLLVDDLIASAAGAVARPG